MNSMGAFGSAWRIASNTSSHRAAFSSRRQSCQSVQRRHRASLMFGYISGFSVERKIRPFQQTPRRRMSSVFSPSFKLSVTSIAHHCPISMGLPPLTDTSCRNALPAFLVIGKKYRYIRFASFVFFVDKSTDHENTLRKRRSALSPSFIASLAFLPYSRRKSQLPGM